MDSNTFRHSSSPLPHLSCYSHVSVTKYSSSSSDWQESSRSRLLGFAPYTPNMVERCSRANAQEGLKRVNWDDRIIPPHAMGNWAAAGTEKLWLNLLVSWLQISCQQSRLTSHERARLCNSEWRQPPVDTSTENSHLAPPSLTAAYQVTETSG